MYRLSASLFSNLLSNLNLSNQVTNWRGNTSIKNFYSQLQ